jgi:hypothetical protein
VLALCASRVADDERRNSRQQEARLGDAPWIVKTRDRLRSFSRFMKCLKEPLSRMANRQDNTRGAFFEARFKSVAVVDEEALLRTCVYIDLNPVAAKVARAPAG